MNDLVYIPDPQPFWFVDSELLSDVISAEICLAGEILKKYPHLPEWFDNPQSRADERKICFAAAARANLIANISETIAARYEVVRPLTEEESKTFRRISNLIASDAPAWAKEMKSVIERIPSHLYALLPDSLQTERFDESVEQAEAVAALCTQDSIQAFIERALDQQVQRISKRWSTELPLARQYGSSHPTYPPPTKPAKRKATRTRDKVRMKRDRLIAEIDDIAQTPAEFIRLMDDRAVQPLPTWAGWPGTWVKAYRIERLCRLIQQDKYRVLKRVGRKK